MESSHCNTSIVFVYLLASCEGTRNKGILEDLINDLISKYEKKKDIDKDNLQINKDDEIAAWEKYQKEFNTTAKAKVVDENTRKKSFAENLKKIIENNLKTHEKRLFELGLNEYSDMPIDQFRKNLLGLKINKTVSKNETNNGSKSLSMSQLKGYPTNLDLRYLYDTVKNQGICGSCYTFSAIGAVEGLQRKIMGTKNSLSEKQALDCSALYGNHGCEGGFIPRTLQYYIDYGIMKETSYPYIQSVGTCRYSKNMASKVIVQYRKLPVSDYALIQALQYGPVAVGMDAGAVEFQNYRSGIYDHPSCNKNNLNHAVTLVGYGTDTNTGKDYWIIRNSWGNTWGENGYVKLWRNGRNFCGIASEAYQPIFT